jgi:hypothetical protein
MKLAEALLLRADLQKKLASLRERVAQNAVIQEGDPVHEDPNELLREAFGVLKQFERLVFLINEANLLHKLPDGRTLTEAIAHRDALAQQHALLLAAVAATKQDPYRYSAREIKWVATLDVAKLQAQAEDAARRLRELNARVQETNWKVDLDY